jgi:hypothetical protein
LPSVLACDDVIGVEGQGIESSRKMAILASLLGALTNLPDKITVHEL